MASTDEGDGGNTVNRADVGGDANAPVIAGNYNVVVGPQYGSTLTVLLEGERPEPVRRDQVTLLPRKPGTPLGRETELAALAEALADPRGGAVQLWGPPGVGKSALLRHAAHTLAAGPAGVLFLDATGREPEDVAQDMFEACYDAHGYAPSRPELRRLMTGIEMTVYVDNAEYTAEQLRTLMDAAPHATFVFAGRDRSLLGDGVPLPLQGIDRAAAMELLARELGRPVAAADEQGTAEALWETASGRPLLLLRAAALTRLDPSGEGRCPGPARWRNCSPCSSTGSTARRRAPCASWRPSATPNWTRCTSAP